MKQISYTEKHKQPFFSFVKIFLRLISKRPEIELTDEPLPTRCIMVANHVNKRGPVIYNLDLPQDYYVTWGAHEMLGNYHSRLTYLRDVYYLQKRHKNKVIATMLASIEAIFSRMFYRGIKVLPTYTDGRMSKTVATSIECLQHDIPVLIFPEDSSEGYLKVVRNFYSGFILLAEQYYKKTGEDIPVVPLYYTQNPDVIAIGKAVFIQDLKAQGLSRREIADYFCQQVNALAR